MHCDLELRSITLAQGHATPLSEKQQLCEILSRSKMAVRDMLLILTKGICVLWPWTWEYYLGLRS